MTETWKKLAFETDAMLRSPRTSTVVSSAAPTPNIDTTDLYTVTALAEAAEFGEPTGTPVNGQKLIIRVNDDGTARALTWNAVYTTGNLPDTTVIGETLYLVCIYNTGSSKWDVAIENDGIANIVEDTTPQLGADLDGQGNYLVDVQNIPDLVSKGPGYWFDGADDVITVSDDADIDFGTADDFFIEIEFMPSDVTRTTDYLINKEAAGIGYGLYINQDDLYIRLDDDTHDVSAIIGTAVFSDNVKAHVLVSFDRSGSATAYVNGKSVGTVDISSVTDTISSAGDLHIGQDSAGTNEFSGEIYWGRIGNLALTATEVKAFSSGAPVPYKYIGASQTVLTSGTLTIGKRYRIVNWITDDDFVNVGGANVDGTEFTATATTPTKWEASSTVVQIGCVLQLEQDGIGTTQWLDKSGNDLHGTVSGAIAINTQPKLTDDLEYNNHNLVFNTTLTSDDTASGDIITVTFGEDVVFGKLCYPDPTENEWMLALGTNVAAKHPVMGVALETKSKGETGKLLLRGLIRDATYFSAFALGDLLFLSDGTAGSWVNAAPSDSGDIVQIVGWVLGVNYAYFNPDYTYIELGTP